MRIVAGLHKGKRISYPEGDKTRPTRDKVRESVFNILEHAPWSDGLEGARVIDVFAGTGALGLESLSRGAEEVIFIEQDRFALSCCEENIKNLRVAEQSKIIKKDALNLSFRSEHIEKRDVIFLDPPYRKDLGEKALEQLIKGDWIAEGATVVFEMAKAYPEQIPSQFELIDERNYGIAQIKFLKFKG